MSDWKMNQNRNIKIEKITLNIGAGKEQGALEKGMKLLEYNRNPARKNNHTEKNPYMGLETWASNRLQVNTQGKR